MLQVLNSLPSDSEPILSCPPVNVYISLTSNPSQVKYNIGIRRSFLTQMFTASQESTVSLSSVVWWKNWDNDKTSNIPFIFAYPRPPPHHTYSHTHCPNDLCMGRGHICCVSKLLQQFILLWFFNLTIVEDKTDITASSAGKKLTPILLLWQKDSSIYPAGNFGFGLNCICSSP